MAEKHVETRLHRAAEAEMFLGSDVIKALLLSAKDRYFTLWAESQADEVNKREHLHAQYRGLLGLVKELRSFINDGKQLRKTLEADNDNG